MQSGISLPHLMDVCGAGKCMCMLVNACGAGRKKMQAFKDH